MRLSLSALFLATLLHAGGCGGAATTPQDASSPIVSDAGGPQASQSRARLSPTLDGRLEIVHAPDALLDGGWFAVRPDDWPRAEGDAPILAIGFATRNDEQLHAHLWAMRQVTDLEHLRVDPLPGPEAAPDSKQFTTITSAEPTEVVLPVGRFDGVGSGDLYFLIDPERPATRAGESAVGLVRIIDAGEHTATARVEHAAEPLHTGLFARFVQTTLDRPDIEATLAFAPLLGEDAAAGRLPRIATALPAYLDRFNISNVAVVSLDTALDPASVNADEAVRRVAPDERFGTLVYGRLEGDELLFHATAFGNSPHATNTVGILPGGLRLPLGESLGQLSEQLAPSFLATSLALRGDHALAIYLLERTLADVELHEDVAYHLREHLALRYATLGDTRAAFQLMNDDVRRAEASDNLLALLNALSIRTYLGSMTGLDALWLEDAERFLSLAPTALLGTDLFYERVHVADALRANGREDEAEALLLALAEEANANGDAERQSIALSRLAHLFGSSDPVTAAMMVSEALEALGDASDLDDLRRSLELLAAEMYLEAADPMRARDALGRAIGSVSRDTSPASRAQVFRVAAALLPTLGGPDDAWQAQREATIALIESVQYARAGAAMIELAMQLMQRANQLPGMEGLPLFVEARSNLHLAAEMMQRLGHNLEAAKALLYVAVTETRFQGDATVTDELFDRALHLARASAAYATVYEIYLIRSRTAEAAGAWDEARTYRESALRWAEYAGEDPDLLLLSPPGL